MNWDWKEKLAVSKTNRGVWIVSGILAIIFALAGLRGFALDAEAIFNFNVSDAWVNVVVLLLYIVAILASIAAGVLAFARRPQLVPLVLIVALAARLALRVFLYVYIGSVAGFEYVNFFSVIVPLGNVGEAFTSQGALEGIVAIISGLAFYAGIVYVVLGYRALKNPTPDLTAAERSAKSRTNNSPVPAGTTAPTAIAAVVFAILSPLAGLIFAYTSRADIRRSAGKLGGENVANTAIILAWIFLVLSVIGLIIYVVTLATLASRVF